MREGLAPGELRGDDRGEEVSLPFAAGVVGVPLLVGCDEGVLVASPFALGSLPPHEATITANSMVVRRRGLMILDFSGTTNGSWPREIAHDIGFVAVRSLGLGDLHSGGFFGTLASRRSARGPRMASDARSRAE